MNASVITGAVAQGLLWSIMAMGIYISYRILDFSDLTSEGSFTLGAATAATLIFSNHVNPFLAVFISMIVGALAGFVTGILHTKLKIPTLLSGILSMTALYSINLRIMGKANISLNQTNTIFTDFRLFLIKVFPMLETTFQTDRDVAIYLGIIFSLLVLLIIWLIMHTEIGYAIRATGDNENMIRAAGVNTNLTKILGLMIGNGLVALSGALVCQYSGFADVGMGIGAIVIGLASVIIGEVFFGRSKILLSLFGIIFGSIVYRIIIALALKLEILPPNDLRLFTAILVAFFLSTPAIKGKIFSPFKKPTSKGGVE